MRLEGLKIGVIEDDSIVGESLTQALELEGADVLWWSTGAQALEALTHANRDIYICDIRLPDMNGEEIFATASLYRSAAPFLFMTAFGDVEQAVALMKKGGGDYLTKPFDFEDMLGRVLTLVPTRETRLTKGALGPSEAMLEIEQTLKRVSATRMPVLLSGETGVGKEVCARFLHDLSTEDASPFLAVNCAAISESTVEMVLFGAERPELYRGYAERAKRGTLYLDGISNLSLGLQPKLLRLLEDETFFRQGGVIPVHFDAKVVCTTTIDLKEMQNRGEFREDLFFRINTVSIEIPPLRQRPDDIIWLADRFLNDIASFTGHEPKLLSSEASDRLLNHSWPGNVRELRNRIERANSLTQTKRILPEDLFTGRPEDSDFDNRIAKLSEVRDLAEKRQIKLALNATGGNVSQAAKTLGVSRTTMWEKMLKHEISSKED